MSEELHRSCVRSGAQDPTQKVRVGLLPPQLVVSNRQTKELRAAGAQNHHARIAVPRRGGLIRVAGMTTVEKCFKEVLAVHGGDWSEVLRCAMDQVRTLANEIDASIAVSGRVKSATSTVNKMRGRRLGAHQIFDIVGVRAITRSTRDCYRLVSLIQNELLTLDAEFDDYVLVPKRSGYRAVHTTIVSPSGLPVEIQVRADWMQRIAQCGSALHTHHKARQQALRNGEL